MRAVTFENYGDASVLTLRDDLPIPDMTDAQILVRVEAAALNPFDRYMMTGMPKVLRIAAGWSLPKMLGLGQDFAGTVVSVGARVTKFKVGDRVFGDVGEHFKSTTRAFADYVCVTENDMVRCPEHLTAEQAAGIPMAGRTALIAIRDNGQIRPGQRVLIYGASGGVGSFAVQIAKILGANVTAVCSAANRESVQSLGADWVVDYQTTSLSDLDRDFHAVIDIAGVTPLKEWESLLMDGGRYVQVGAPYQEGLLGPLKNSLMVTLRALMRRNWSWSTVNAKRDYQDREWLVTQANKQQLCTLIGQTFPIEKIQEAMRVIESGHTGGKIIITIDNATDETIGES